MQLDVILPTYNRQELLKRALRSLRAAEVPSGLVVRVTVVDNNCKDHTRQVVEEHMGMFNGRLDYVFEGRQGKCFALNSGIASTDGQLVGMIDDDEEIDRHWFSCIYSAFGQGNVDFIGGPYLPRWGAAPPQWLPKDYPSVIGWIEGGDKVMVYGKEYPGMLCGGNAVLTRSVLEKVGPYSGTGKVSLPLEEDIGMYQRLLAIGARGLYLPDLIIYHFIPPERLTKRYHRRWCFRKGLSTALMETKQREEVVYLGRVPRYLYGKASRALVRIAQAMLSKHRDPSKMFSDELSIWYLAGFVYGTYFCNKTSTHEIGHADASIRQRT